MMSQEQNAPLIDNTDYIHSFDYTTATALNGLSYLTRTGMVSVLNTTPSGNARFAELHHSNNVPVNLTQDIQSTAALVNYLPPGIPRFLSVLPTNGITFRRIHIAPGEELPMARSFTVDYVVVAEGTVELSLDGGDIRILSAGDTVVQRATNGRWKNLSTRQFAKLIMVIVYIQQRAAGVFTIGANVSALS
jgi:quercetin dioxygenase-like cupin family protein